MDPRGGSAPWLVGAGLLGIVGGWLALANAYWFVCDDAWISFRYAHNWAIGEGIRFNPGTVPPVEGYSNFLWVAIAALGETLGIRPDRLMPWLSMGCGVGVLLTTFHIARERLAFGPGVALATVAVLAAQPSLVIWATSGLATMPMTWLVLIMVERLVLADDRRAWIGGAAAALLLALVRTEGVAWFGVVGVLGLLRRLLEPDEEGGGPLDLVKAGAVVMPAWGAYFLWRWGYYDSLLANTAYAKVGMSTTKLLRGLDYVLGYWVAVLAPALQLLVGPAIWPVARWRGVVLALMAIAFPAYGVVVGGDFMTYGRLMVPGLPFAALLFGAALHLAARRGRALALAVGLVGLFGAGAGLATLDDQHVVSKEARASFRVRFNTRKFRSEVGQWAYMKNNAVRWSRQGQALGDAFEPGEDSVVLGAIGAAGYFSGLHVFDRYGLVSREVALREGKAGSHQSPGHDKVVSPMFFLDDEPTVLWSKLLRGAKGLERAEREARPWRARVGRLGYGPVLHRVEVDNGPGYLLAIQPVKDPDRAYARMERDIEAWLAEEAESEGAGDTDADTDDEG